ncbi:MAG: hypothetical protein ABSB61_10845 [Anaerolineales bacterium]
MHVPERGCALASGLMLETPVSIKRGWFDGGIVAVPLGVLEGFHMSGVGGGIGHAFPRAMLCTYMSCADLPKGQWFGHSCAHGEGPHWIKVAMTRLSNKAIYSKLLAMAEAEKER